MQIANLGWMEFRRTKPKKADEVWHVFTTKFPNTRQTYHDMNGYTRVSDVLLVTDTWSRKTRHIIIKRCEAFFGEVPYWNYNFNSRHSIFFIFFCVTLGSQLGPAAAHAMPKYLWRIWRISDDPTSLGGTSQLYMKADSFPCGRKGKWDCNRWNFRAHALMCVSGLSNIFLFAIII